MTRALAKILSVVRLVLHSDLRQSKILSTLYVTTTNQERFTLLLVRSGTSRLCVFKIFRLHYEVLGSIVVSIPACHAGDRGSIPRRGGHHAFLIFFLCTFLFFFYQNQWNRTLIGIFLNDESIQELTHLKKK